MRDTREQDAYAEDLHRRAAVIQTLRELGAVDLRQPRRTLGFEKRSERADERPRTQAAWGEAPHPRD